MFCLVQHTPTSARPRPPQGRRPLTEADEAKKAEPSWRISGLMFGDYYWFAADHRDVLEEQNGFWLRRIFLTYDQKFSEAFSTRVRLEMNSPGPTTTTIPCPTARRPTTCR